MVDDEAAFLAAIADRPADTLTRYVFSDWLEDRDDERCRWVRDDDLWPWMGPHARNPIPALLRHLNEPLERLHTFARERGVPPLAEEWDRILTDSDVVRLVELLVKCGPLVVPHVLDRLTHAEPWPRLAVQIGAPFPEALCRSVDVLLRHAETGRPEVALAAKSLLVRAAERDVGLVDGIVMDIGRSGDPRTEQALLALRHARGPAADQVADYWLAPLAEELRRRDVDDLPLVVGKLNCLGNMAEIPVAAQTLFEAALRDYRPAVSVVAAAALARLSEHVAATAAVRGIRDCTADNRASAFALFRAAWPDWVARLLDLFRDRRLREQTRLGIVESLSFASESDWPGVRPVLRQAIRDADEAMRRVGQIALARAAVPLELVLPEFRLARTESSVAVRAAGIHALIHRGGYPSPLQLEELVVAIAEQGSDIPEPFLSLVEELGLEEALSEQARHMAARVAAADRAAATRTLGYWQTHSAESFPVLVALLDDPDLDVRRAAAQAISWSIGPTARGVYKPLKRALRDADPIIRGAAARAFGELGRRAAELLPELLDRTRDPVPIARAGALYAVGMIDPEGPAVRSAVHRGLADENNVVVVATLEGLMDATDLRDRKLLTRVERLASHANSRVRECAFFVLKNFDDDELTAAHDRSAADALADPALEVAEAAFEYVLERPDLAARTLPQIMHLYARPGCTIRGRIGEQLDAVQGANAGFARLLAHPDPAVRYAAMVHIEAIGAYVPRRRP